MKLQECNSEDLPVLPGFLLAAHWSVSALAQSAAHWLLYWQAGSLCFADLQSVTTSVQRLCWELQIRLVFQEGSEH